MAQFKFWDWFTVHVWLLFSSYGIMFAILSFFDEIGCLEHIKDIGPGMKGGLSLFLGIIFYLLIGIPHIKGTDYFKK